MVFIILSECPQHKGLKIFFNGIAIILGTAKLRCLNQSAVCWFIAAIVEIKKKRMNK